MEPARVSSPQVDLTRYGLDKTPTLLILRCLGVDPLRPKGKEVPATDARPRWQSRGEARRGQKVATTSLPAREKGVPAWCYRHHHPLLGRTVRSGGPIA